MDPIVLNDITISYPAGFHVLDDAERGRLHFIEVGDGVCLSDPERHMLISIAYKKVGGLTSVLLKGRDLAKAMETAVRKSMQPFEYQSVGSIKRMVGSCESEGFCYTYTAQNIPMYGESLVLRSGKAAYYFHLYARDGLRAESIPVWEELLGSVDIRSELHSD